MKPLHTYFVGTGSWFFAYGIQTVTFAWLVTIVLDESPGRVGFAQMCFLAPAIVLMLVGGSLADQYGGRRIAFYAQLAAASAPIFLTVMIVTDHFSYATMIVFAIIMGCAQSLVTPARDGLLALVADGRIQRKVVQASMVQFGVQMLGFITASFADQTGAVFILLVQAGALLLGAVAFYNLDVPFHPPATPKNNNIFEQIRTSIVEGFHSVKASPPMRMVVLQNCAMGTFFMGSYLVTLPILVRELYDGSSQELSLMNAGNALGLVITIFLLLKFGDIIRQGRALLLAQGIGAFALASAGSGLGLYALILSVFCWGLCGGIAMTMSRTIMQEQAPEDQRARMMAFYAFSFMGSGPIGAIFSGFLVEWYGPVVALTIASMLMFLVVVIVGLTSQLWNMGKQEAGVAYKYNQ
ncbi:MAG: MFS transporter [Proteobacteria bacterium]|nr:MFS transporter [Pseudomonadota bacterium]